MNANDLAQIFDEAQPRRTFPDHVLQSYEDFARVARKRGFRKRAPEVVHFRREVQITAATDIGSPVVVDMLDTTSRMPTPVIPDVTITQDPPIRSGSAIGTDMLIGLFGAALLVDLTQFAVANRAAFQAIYERSVVEAFASDDRRMSLSARYGLLQVRGETRADLAAAVNGNAQDNLARLAAVPLTVWGQGQTIRWTVKLPAPAWPAATNHQFEGILGLFVARM